MMPAAILVRVRKWWCCQMVQTVGLGLGIGIPVCPVVVHGCLVWTSLPPGNGVGFFSFIPNGRAAGSQVYGQVPE